ncbi:MAG: triose-phosphate isomerase [Rickettsiales bacterium]
MTTPPTWLIANWKMNGDGPSVRAWAFAIDMALADHTNTVRAVFCPPVIFMADARAALPGNAQLKLGAQNCHEQTKGAFTGELSAAMLMDAGCDFSILGHSERRALGETDEQVLAKAKSALAVGLMPIICIGESLEAYEKKQTNSALDTQLAPLTQLPRGGYLIAYEPIWAIGTSRTPTMVEINAAHSHIKSVLGSSVGVLYGGSVNAGNAEEILAQTLVSGALIGGASLEIESMRAILASAPTRGK